MKDDEDYDVLCKIEASSKEEALEKLKGSKNNLKYEEGLDCSKILIHSLDELTDLFYD